MHISTRSTTGHAPIIFYGLWIVFSRSVSGAPSKLRPDTRQGSRSNLPAPKRSNTTPDTERERMLSTATEFTNPSQTKLSETTSHYPSHGPSRDAPAQAILCSDKRASSTPIANDIEQVRQKISYTIDELVNSGDYKVRGCAHSVEVFIA